MQEIERPGPLEVPHLFEHPVEKGPLLFGAQVRGVCERGARRDGDEVEAPGRQVGELGGQQGEPPDPGEGLTYLEPVDVLAGDVGIGAYVHDIYAPARIPEMVHYPGNDPPGYQGLAQTGLVGN